MSFTNSARSALVALLSCSALVACRGPVGESERIVRFVEQSPTIAALPDPPEPPGTLELAEPTMPFALAGEHGGAAFRPAPEGYDQRAGFFGPAGTGYRFAIEIGAAATLRFGFAAWAPEGDTQPVRFRVVARQGRQESEIASEEFAPSPEALWRTAAVPLSGFGAGKIEIELVTEGPAATWAGWATPEVAWNPPRRRRPNVILVSLDTLRADRLNSYGYQRRVTTPALDGFAARSLRFAWAISQAPWTRPSHRSMFSGRYPSFVEDGGDFLAYQLWQRHYRTLGMVGGGQLDKQFGFAYGFETYQATQWIHRPHQVIEAIAENPDRELFLLLHTYEIHDPYTDHRFTGQMPRGRVGESFGHKDRDRIRKHTRPEEKEYISALYDGDLAYTDENLRTLFDLFEREGVLDNSIVMITSDHGEEFWEHGVWRHGQNLYDTLLHVPLIVWLPPDLRARFATAYPAAGGPAVIDDQVGLIDLVPTLFELLDLEPPAGLQGRSLTPLMRGERMPERPLLAENLYMTSIQKYALRSRRYKLIAPRPDRKLSPEILAAIDSELYDLLRDAAELDDTAARFPRVVQRLEKELARIAQGGELDETSEPATEDEKLRKELEALGYIGN